MRPGQQVRGPESGISLIGTIGTLIVLGLLGAIVFKALGDMGKDDGSPTGSLLNEINDPAGAGGLGGVPPTDEPAAPSARGPAGLAQVASVDECIADVSTIRSAASTYQVQTGTFPASLGDLVSAGFLSSVPSRPRYAFSLEVANGQPTGGVMVNGLPGEQGCRAPATP